jgi:regulator of sigma E protease
MPVFFLVVGILLFISLVIIHELGHMIVALRNGVEVEEFAVFFPPRLLSHKTKKGYVVSLNLLPLGGYVKLKGEHDSDTEKGSFGAASVWSKVKIMVAGVLVNIVAAYLLFVLLALVGMPKLINNQFTVKSNTTIVKSSVEIDTVQSGSPASKAGIKPYDQILSIHAVNKAAARTITNNDLRNITGSYAGKTVVVKLERGGKTFTKNITLLSPKVVDASLKTKDPKGYLGVSVIPVDFQLQKSTWSAPIVAAGLSVQLTGQMFVGIGHAIGGLGSLIAGAATGNTVARHHGSTNATQNLVGPVGLYALLKTLSQIGFQYVLFIIAYISLALGIFNLFPLPALDGGRIWLTTLLPRLFKKRALRPKTEELINVTGLVVLLALSVVIAIVNVKEYF